MTNLSTPPQSSSDCAPKRCQQPNIVLFVAEDLDYEGLGCYDTRQTGMTGLRAAGNPYAQGFERHDRSWTPTIDAMASRGFQAHHYYCPSAICTPARYSLLTGRYPERSREFCEMFPSGSQANVFFNTGLTREEETLPKAFQAAGYRTAICGKWHNFPQHIKMRLTDILRSIPIGADPKEPAVRQTLASWYSQAADFLRDGFGWDVVDRLYFDNPEPFHPAEIACHNLEWIIEGALKFLDEQSRTDQPFFLYVPVTVPHERYRENIFETSNPLATPSGLLDKRPGGMPARETIIQRVRDRGLPPYAREALWLDEAVHALQRRLAELKLRETTCFIFTSDHPTAGKQTCHLGRVPLIVDWPALAPKQSDALLSHLDLAPTLLDLADIKAPSAVGQDGFVFTSHLVGEESSSPRNSLLMEVVHSRAIVKNGFKYIVNAIPQDLPATGDPRETGWLIQRTYDNRERGPGIAFDADKLFPHYLDSEQLYDLATDPLEQINLAGTPKYRPVLNEIRGDIIAELAKLPHPFSLPPTGTTPATH